MLIWQQKHLWPEHVNELYSNDIHFIVLDTDECTDGPDSLETGGILTGSWAGPWCPCLAF